MEQASPDFPSLRSPIQIGFIGAGRLAGALAPALQRADAPVAYVASRHLESAHALAQRLHGCRAIDAQQLAEHCDLVFVTPPDAEISAVARRLHWHPGQAVVHCSGATPVTALQPARDAGARVGGFHPMQAFGADADAALASLPGCTIAIEATDPTLGALLRDLARRLGCSALDLPPEARARYHAAGGYASQHVHVLLAEAVQLWRSWGASEAQALAALLPLLRGTLESIARSGVAKGMPGPVSRGDADTVRRHRQALQSLDPDMRALHDELCRRSIALARAAKRLDDHQVQALRHVLDEPFDHEPDPSERKPQ